MTSWKYPIAFSYFSSSTQVFANERYSLANILTWGLKEAGWGVPVLSFSGTAVEKENEGKEMGTVFAPLHRIMGEESEY